MSLILPDELAARVEAIARQEKRTPEDVLKAMISQYIPNLPPESDTEGVRQVRLQTYARARRYWEQAGDQERLALTDEELDDQFWLIDPDGIPRLKSDQVRVELPANALLMMAEAAAKADLAFTHHDVAQHSREILESEFANDLLRRMRNDNAAE